jgi:hypothetical protein
MEQGRKKKEFNSKGEKMEEKRGRKGGEEGRRGGGGIEGRKIHCVFCHWPILAP